MGDFGFKSFSYISSGKDPWVDQSCADRPGFPVLSAGDAPPPKLHPGASKCALGLHLFSWPFEQILGSAAPSFPTIRAKTGRTAHVFAAQGVTYRFPGCFSGISKPVVWGTRGLHPGFPWFSSFSWFL